MNPSRGGRTEYRPARVTVAMVVHIPHLAGYFADRLNVLKVSLASLMQHTDAPYDLMVFDNGCGEEARTYLQELHQRGVVRFLLSSAANIGKISALQILFRAAPGEIIAYSDDDFFFYPGWLSAHLRILDEFPNVGMVSGGVVRAHFDRAIESNLAFADQNPKARLVRGQSIPEAWELDWAASTGRKPAEHLERIRGKEDILLEWEGRRAYAAAHHSQFVAPKGVLVDALPREWSGRLMGGVAEMDERIDQAGYLRLSTVERFCRHIGNFLDDEMWVEASRFGFEPAALGLPSRGAAGAGRLAFLGRLPWLRRVLLAVHNATFQLLNPEGSRRGGG